MRTNLRAELNRLTRLGFFSFASHVSYRPAILSCYDISCFFLDRSTEAAVSTCPRSVGMNIGIQREIHPGLVFSTDFVRNVQFRSTGELCRDYGEECSLSRAIKSIIWADS